MRPIPTSQQRPVPGAMRSADGALEALRLIRWGVEQRRSMMNRGFSRMDHHTVDRLLIPLERWLNGHPTYASAASVKEFMRLHGATLRVVMPGTRAGEKKLEQLDSILFHL